MKVRKSMFLIAKYLITIIIIIIFTSPFIWMVIISTQKEVWILQTPPTLRFDLNVIAENYKDVIFFRSGGFIYAVRNSIIVVIVSVIMALLIGVPAAYGLTRFKGKRNRDIAFFILSTRFMPPIVIAFPIFLMISAIHLVNTYLGLALPYIVMNLPFVVWMMRAFLKDIPAEIDESAMIDGCSRFQALWKVIVPIASPGLVATGIFCAILTWNELLFALHLVSTTEAATVTVMASGSMAMERPLEWHLITAEGVFIILPIIFLSILVQKHIVKGLTMGALKG